MPKYRMTYPYPINNARHGRLEPDEVIEADENPDGNFFELVEEEPPAKATAKPKTAPAEAEAPASEEN